MIESTNKDTEAPTPAEDETPEAPETLEDAAPAPEAEAADEAAAPDAAASEPTAADGEEASPPDPLALLEKDLADTKDKLLRALAETENVRRRAQKDREDMSKYAITNFARDVLTVADNLRRALDAIPEEARRGDDTVKSIVEGVELTERELLAAFDRYGIKKVDPMGEKFNHDFHEAMFEVPTADAAPGTVVQVMEIGYVLHDRLLRPARVGVAKALPEAPQTEGVDTTA